VSSKTPIVTAVAVCFLFLLARPPAARAVSPHTETFDGASGWTALGGASVAETGGEVVASFPRVVPLPPDAVLLTATNGASGGAFTGDYVRAGIELAGFRFRADNAVPASLLIQLRSGLQFYSSSQLNTQVLQTGAWYEVWTRVGSAEWSGQPSVLTNVQEFAIYIRPASSEAETCRVDNVFIDILPSGDVQRGPEGTSLLTWSHLRAGWNYRVQACGDLAAGGWSNTAAFIATDSSEELVVTNAGDRSIWRLSN